MIHYVLYEDMLLKIYYLSITSGRDRDRKGERDRETERERERERERKGWRKGDVCT